MQRQKHAKSDYPRPKENNNNEYSSSRKTQSRHVKATIVVHLDTLATSKFRFKEGVRTPTSIPKHQHSWIDDFISLAETSLTWVLARKIRQAHVNWNANLAWSCSLSLGRPQGCRPAMLCASHLSCTPFWQNTSRLLKALGHITHSKRVAKRTIMNIIEHLWIKSTPNPQRRSPPCNRSVPCREATWKQKSSRDLRAVKIC